MMSGKTETLYVVLNTTRATTSPYEQFRLVQYERRCWRKSINDQTSCRVRQTDKWTVKETNLSKTLLLSSNYCIFTLSLQISHL